MLLYLSLFLTQFSSIFNAFTYITSRSIFAFLTSMIFGILFFQPFINMLRNHKIKQTIRNDGPSSHIKNKVDIPTMGGLVMVLSSLFSVIIWSDIMNFYIQVSAISLVSFALIGFFDDLLKVLLNNHKGVSARFKIFFQSIVAIAIIVLLYLDGRDLNGNQLRVFIPFLKNFSILSVFLFSILSFVTIIGSSNAVNLTDGLDGLAIVPTIIVLVVLGVFAYVTGNYFFADYLKIPYIPNSGEMVVFISALIGAGSSFLWYNSYPAQIFMGDVGSLSLGGIIGTIAVIIRQEFILLIAGGVFVIEALSVIIQVFYFKCTGKRVFKMAPLHHHFELMGVSEPKLIVRFWLVSIIFALLAILTLKIR